MITCNICGKEFQNRKAFSRHLTTVESKYFDSELSKERFVVDTIYGKEMVDSVIQCYSAGEISMHGLCTTVNICKLITLMGLKRTSSEERHTPRHKKKMQDMLQQKYGEGITNVSQVPHVREKIKQTVERVSGMSYESYLVKQRIKMKDGYDAYIGTDKHEQTIEKTKKTCLQRYGNENFGLGVDATEKRRLSLRKTIAEWDYAERLARTNQARAAVNHRGGYSSSLEKQVQHALVEMNVTFIANAQMFDYNYDIVLTSSGVNCTIIEVQGDFWHANPAKYTPSDLIMGKILASTIWEKDRRKKEAATKNGFKLVAIWEHEIKKCKNVNALIALIESKLKE